MLCTVYVQAEHLKLLENVVKIFICPFFKIDCRQHKISSATVWRSSLDVSRERPLDCPLVKFQERMKRCMLKLFSDPGMLLQK